MWQKILRSPHVRGALSVRTRAVISGVRSSEAVGWANKSGGRAPALASHHQPPPHNATYYSFTEISKQSMSQPQIVKKITTEISWERNSPFIFIIVSRAYDLRFKIWIICYIQVTSAAWESSASIRGDCSMQSTGAWATCSSWIMCHGSRGRHSLGLKTLQSNKRFYPEWMILFPWFL